MFRFVLFACRPLTVDELLHALGIPHDPDTEFTPSDEYFQQRIPVQRAITPSSHAAEGLCGIDAIERRIIHCGGNFLEIKRHHGTVVSSEKPPYSRANKDIGNSSVQVMHQTVREFFLRPDGYVASSKFRMEEKDAHTRISMACIRYLMLCAANTTLANKLPSIKYWTPEHFEAYARYLNERPLISYAISNTT